MKYYCLLFLLGTLAEGARLKDLATLRGARNNQLMGYGVVVGLSGTGDKSNDMTDASLGLALKGLGVELKTKPIEAKNSAAVVVSMILPPFTKAGAHLDVNVSSIGTATSLDGGTLLMTPLRGPDGNVYAMSQGKIEIQKRSEGGGKAAGQTLVTATVPGGALLEKEVPFDFSAQRELRYFLSNPDFTTAARISHRINEELGGKYAGVLDAGTVQVIIPYQFNGTPAELVAQIESVDVEADSRAKVVINQRTGTVVLGERVQLTPVAIAHNNLRLEVKGATPKSAGGAEVKGDATFLLKGGATIADVVAALNETGATSDDLVDILQTLKSAGSLLAEVEVK